MAETVRTVAIYSGWVQGVGFRFTTRRAAAGFAVAGCVRNLPSGDVEVVAEGAREVIEVQGTSMTTIATMTSSKLHLGQWVDLEHVVLEIEERLPLLGGLKHILVLRESRARVALEDSHRRY